MSLASPMIFDNGTQRPFIQGDILNSAEIQNALVNAGNATITAQQILGSLLFISGGAALTHTTPDSSTWLNALLQNQLVAAGATTPAGVQVGTSYRMRMVNNNSGTTTIAAGTNVSTSGTLTLAAGTCRDFLITVLSGTPQQVLAATTTNASAVITGLSAAQTMLLSPGMVVSGAGITGGTTVLSVQPGVGVTLSANATATGSLVALTFNPRIQLASLGGGMTV